MKIQFLYILDVARLYMLSNPVKDFYERTEATKEFLLRLLWANYWGREAGLLTTWAIHKNMGLTL